MCTGDEWRLFGARKSGISSQVQYKNQKSIKDQKIRREFFKYLECSIRVLVRGICEFVNGWISGRDSETVDSGQFKSVLNVVLNANQHMKFTLDFPKALWFFDKN